MNYANLTDEELLRAADGQDGLTKALADRLEARQRPPTTMLTDVAALLHMGVALPEPATHWLTQDSTLADPMTRDELLVSLLALLAHGIESGTITDDIWGVYINALLVGKRPDYTTLFDATT